MDETVNAENKGESGIEKRLKNLRPWKPGQSAKGGRPKGSVSIVSALKRQLKQKDPATGRKLVDEVAAAIIANAVKRKIPASQEMLTKYVDGPPKQQIDVGFNGPVPIVFKFDGVEHRDPSEDVAGD